jgi:ribonuclease BN (tRNA processing enzyme)
VGFEVVVLGASGTYPVPESACSGYLLRSDGTDIWVDAGPGSFQNLQRHVNFRKLRALFLSHLHADHVLDVYPFYYAMRYGIDADGSKGFEVYAPTGTERHLTGLVGSGEPTSEFGGVLDFREILAGGQISVPPFEFRFRRSVHPIETLAMRVTAEGRTLAYSADTGPSDDLAGFFEGADSFICEATLQQEVPELAEVHLTAEEAGKLAADAKVGRLILTHIMPGLDRQVSVEQARKHFDGEILLATDNVRFEV